MPRRLARDRGLEKQLKVFIVYMKLVLNIRLFKALMGVPPKMIILTTAVPAPAACSLSILTTQQTLYLYSKAVNHIISLRTILILST